MSVDDGSDAASATPGPRLRCLKFYALYPPAPTGGFSCNFPVAESDIGLQATRESITIEFAGHPRPPSMLRLRLLWTIPDRSSQRSGIPVLGSAADWPSMSGGPNEITRDQAINRY
jgi:hypothetical protein